MPRSNVLLLVFVLLFSLGIDAQQPPAATMAERTRGLERTDGFIPFFWDAARGRVLFEIPVFAFLRAPSRLAIVVVLALVVCGSLATARLLAVAGRYRAWACAALLLLAWRSFFRRAGDFAEEL